MPIDAAMPILVVDDYQTMVRIIRNLLKQIGFENVDEASNGEAALGMFLNGDAISSRGPRGEPIDDDSFVLLFNAHFEDRQFRLPRANMGARWTLELSTAEPDAEAGSAEYGPRELVDVMAHSITILKRTQ